MVFAARLHLCHQQTLISLLPTLPEWDLLCGFLPLTLLLSSPVVTFSPVSCLHDLFHNKLQSHTDNLHLKVFRATETSPSKPPLHLPYSILTPRPWLSKHPLPWFALHLPAAESSSVTGLFLMCCAWHEQKSFAPQSENTVK